MSSISSMLSAVPAYMYSTVTSFFSYELPSTEKALEQAIKRYGKEILKYYFKVEERALNPLEFAIYLGNQSLVADLLKLGASMEQVGVNSASPLYFYLSLLQEDKRPDLELLKVLLDAAPNMSAIGLMDRLNVLQYAVEKMRGYRCLDCGLLELLFKKKVEIEVSPTPFEILSDLEKRGESQTGTEEISHLTELSRYIQLERKFYPSSMSFLSLDQFADHTEKFRKELINPELSVEHFKSNCETYQHHYTFFIGETEFSDQLHPISLLKQWRMQQTEPLSHDMESIFLEKLAFVAGIEKKQKISKEDFLKWAQPLKQRLLEDKKTTFADRTTKKDTFDEDYKKYQSLYKALVGQNFLDSFEPSEKHVLEKKRGQRF